MPELFILDLSKGLSTGKTTSDFDDEALAVGAEVEKEHTDDPKVAQRIAMDHLTEDKDYYVKLDRIENKEVSKTMMDQMGIQKSFEEEESTMYGMKKSYSPMADNQNRDGETVDNRGQEDYFGPRDELKDPHKGDKLKIAKGKKREEDEDMDKQIVDPAASSGGPSTSIGAPMQFSHTDENDLLKGGYFDIYVNNKTGTGKGENLAHLAPKTKYQPTKEKGEKAETTGKGQALRNIEVRDAGSKTGNRGANQDAYDEATQGRLLKLQTTDKSKVIYLSVTHKTDGQIMGYTGETADRAEFNDGQGRQDTLRNIKVLGETRWTAEVIPKKKLTKGFDTTCQLFAMAPESPSLLKSIEDNNLCHTAVGVAPAEVTDEGMKKSYDFVNAFISILHKSMPTEDVFPALQEQAKDNVVLAKSIESCGIDEPYVHYYAGTIHNEQSARDSTNYLVDKVVKQFS